MEWTLFHIAAIAIFVIAYILIVFEHPLRLNKTVPALFAASLGWAIVSYGFQLGSVDIIDHHGHLFNTGINNSEAQTGFTDVLLHHLGKTSEILIFLIGAMTIVELIDLHRGFDIIQRWIRTRKKTHLLWIIGFLAFFLSAVIDNLTTTIVLITLLRRIIHSRKEKLWFASLIVIAANAGGAWSPIGDVTTTMLWIAHKTTTLKLIESLILPSLVCFVIPAFVLSKLPIMKGNVYIPEDATVERDTLLSSRMMLFVGLGGILSVPFFKGITHLPPYLGMALALGFVWMISEYIHPEEEFSEDRRHLYSAHRALSRIEMSSILFFFGILMAVASLETIAVHKVSVLEYAAEQLDMLVPNRYVVFTLLGFFSAIIDNVPLVAAAMGMYDFPTDHHLWHYLAYTAGTGGSMLIIGSAAGVAAMGLEKIEFIWYLKRIGWLALIGFLAGAAVFILMSSFHFT